jgi:hypothetical protein
MAALGCAACAVLTAVLLPGASAGASGPRCFFKVYGPLTQPDNTLLSKGTFRCSVGYRAAGVSVAVQRRVQGRWTTVAAVHRTMNVAAGRSYTVSVSVPCRAALGPTGVTTRTFFDVATHSGRLVLPSAGGPTLCTLGQA